MTFSEWATITHTIEVTIGKEFEIERIKMYFELLKDLRTEDVQRAVVKLLQERVYSNIPQPGEIRQIALGKLDSLGMSGLFAWNKYNEGIDKQRFEGFLVEKVMINGELRPVDGYKKFLSKLNPEILQFATKLGRDFAMQVSALEDTTWQRKEFLERWEVPRNREDESLRLPDPDNVPVAKLVNDLAAKLKVVK